MISQWLTVKAGVSLGSTLGPLFFAIYINDLSLDIVTSAKLFADDTSVFSIVYNAKTTTYELNKDLQRIAEQANQWKMQFNLDLKKQAPHVTFSRKMNLLSHLQICFNSVPSGRNKDFISSRKFFSNMKTKAVE